MNYIANKNILSLILNSAKCTDLLDRYYITTINNLSSDEFHNAIFSLISDGKISIHDLKFINDKIRSIADIESLIAMTVSNEKCVVVDRKFLSAFMKFKYDKEEDVLNLLNVYSDIENRILCEVDETKVQAIVVAVLKHNGKFILLKNIKSSSQLYNNYDFPSGHMSNNQSPRDELLRELKEELDIDKTNINKMDYLFTIPMGNIKYKSSYYHFGIVYYVELKSNTNIHNIEIDKHRIEYTSLDNIDDIIKYSKSSWLSYIIGRLSNYKNILLLWNKNPGTMFNISYYRRCEDG